MRVNTTELQTQATQLNKSFNQLREIQERIRRAENHLMDDSIGEDFRLAFESELDAIEKLLLNMVSLQQILLSVAEEYEACENSILDYAEVGGQTLGKSAKVINLPGVISRLFAFDEPATEL